MMKFCDVWPIETSTHLITYFVIRNLPWKSTNKKNKKKSFRKKWTKTNKIVVNFIQFWVELSIFIVHNLALNYLKLFEITVHGMPSLNCWTLRTVSIAIEWSGLLNCHIHVWIRFKCNDILCFITTNNWYATANVTKIVCFLHYSRCADNIDQQNKRW